MDEETKAAFREVDRKLDVLGARMDAKFDAVMTSLNALGERLGDRTTNCEDDVGTLYSAVTVARQRWIDLDRRVRKLEKDDE